MFCPTQEQLGDVLIKPEMGLGSGDRTERERRGKREFERHREKKREVAREMRCPSVASRVQPSPYGPQRASSVLAHLLLLVNTRVLVDIFSGMDEPVYSKIGLEYKSHPQTWLI